MGRHSNEEKARRAELVAENVRQAGLILAQSSNRPATAEALTVLLTGFQRVPSEPWELVQDATVDLQPAEPGEPASPPELPADPVTP